MIFDHIEGPIIEALLRIDSADDYPQLKVVLMPAVEGVMRSAVGKSWIESNESDAAVQQCALALLASWFQAPEMQGKLTSGANFLLSQLQARALEENADG